MGMLITGGKKKNFMDHLLLPARLAGALEDIKDGFLDDRCLASVVTRLLGSLPSLGEYIQMLKDEADDADAVIITSDGDVYSGNGNYLTKLDSNTTEDLNAIAEKYEAIWV